MEDNKYTKDFPNENCPECTGDLTVKTNCDPLKDDDFETWFTEGDSVFCGDCEFQATICVTVDGEAWVSNCKI